MNPKLKKPPTVERWAAAGASKSIGKIDPTGGRYGAGIIPGVSMCSRGEALGHGQWVDGVMLQQIVDRCNANAKLLKSRFAHPGMCSDGTGKSLGTVENASLVGDQAIGDQHFYQTAHRAPDGDLAGYVLSLAAEDPENFGMSIVFEHDFEAEEAFMLANGGEWVTHDDGYMSYQVIEGFVSPDPENTENYPHARIKALCASDIVDDPAANPNGLFHRGDSVPAEGRKVLDFVFGLSAHSPQGSALGIAPERVKEFVSKYLADAGLSVVKEVKTTMPKPKFSLMSSLKALLTKAEESGETDTPAEPKKETEKASADDKTEEEPMLEEGNPEDGPEDPPTNNDEKTEPEKQAKGDPLSAEKLSKFTSKFGAENGSKWATEGINYEAALERHCEALSTSLADANSRLTAIGTLGADPVKFSQQPEKKAGTSKQTPDKLTEVCGEGLGRIAAAIKIPQPSKN